MISCSCPENAKISVGLFPAYKKVKDRVLYYRPSPVKEKPVPDLNDEEDSDMNVEDCSGDEEYVCDLQDLQDSASDGSNNTQKYPLTAMAMMRHNLSPEIVADIVNSAGFDCGWITIEDTSKGNLLSVCIISATKISLLFFSSPSIQTLLSK